MTDLSIFSLEGKNAWVTGASYGIGFNIAKAFAQAGAKNIVFNARSKESLQLGLDNYKAAGIIPTLIARIVFHSVLMTILYNHFMMRIVV